MQARSMLKAAGMTPLLAAMLFAGAAQAAVYHVAGALVRNFNGTPVTIDSYDVETGITIGRGKEFHEFGPGIPSFHGWVSSAADEKGLHAWASTQVINGLSVSGSETGIGLAASSTASVTYFDVVVKGPAGGSVPTSMNLFIDGDRLASSGPPKEISRSQVQIGYSVNDVSVGGGFQVLEGIDGNPVVQRGSGALADFGISKKLTTDTFTVQVGVPFKVFISISAVAESQGVLSESYNLASNTDFRNTLSFVTDGPVFNLPAGYTIDSVEAGIAGNVFAPVPEPAAGLLCAIGALVVVGLARRRRPAGCALA